MKRYRRAARPTWTPAGPTLFSGPAPPRSLRWPRPSPPAPTETKPTSRELPRTHSNASPPLPGRAHPGCWSRCLRPRPLLPGTRPTSGHFRPFSARVLPALSLLRGSFPAPGHGPCAPLAGTQRLVPPPESLRGSERLCRASSRAARAEACRARRVRAGLTPRLPAAPLRPPPSPRDAGAGVRAALGGRRGPLGLQAARAAAAGAGAWQRLRDHLRAAGQCEAVFLRGHHAGHQVHPRVPGTRCSPSPGAPARGSGAGAAACLRTPSCRGFSILWLRNHL